MKTVRFKFVDETPNGTLHCSQAEGDQSGEYVRADDVRELVEAVNKLLDARALSKDFDDALKELDGALANLGAIK